MCNLTKKGFSGMSVENLLEELLLFGSLMRFRDQICGWQPWPIHPSSLALNFLSEGHRPCLQENQSRTASYSSVLLLI